MNFKNIFLLLITTANIAVAVPQEESIQELYQNASEAFQNEKWADVIDYSKIIIKNYSESSLAKEVLFFLGVAYFNLNDYQLANRYFSRYLKGDFSPTYFEEAMHYKFAIAEKYKNGAKKHAFKNKGPKLLSGEEDAAELYDEIINTMPNHDLTAKSLFAKGELLFRSEDYKESVDTFKEVIKNFSKHELAQESYIQIAKVYLKQTTYKHQNIDLLDAAILNYNRFKEKYPENEKVKELEQILSEMKDKFAKGLYDIAAFYEKNKKSTAAILYYNKIINNYPDSKYAKYAQNRLQYLEDENK